MEEHLKAVARQRGITVDIVPPPPSAVAYLWGWYCEVAAFRPQGMSGPAHVPASEIRAWADLTGTTPERWEMLALMALDREFVSISAEHLEMQAQAAKRGGGDG